MVKYFNWLKVNEIIMIAICSGLFNLYFIFKNGLIYSIPYLPSYVIQPLNEIDNTGSIFNISEKEVLLLIFITISYLLVFSSLSKFSLQPLIKSNRKNSFEFFFILQTSLLGLIFILLFNDFISLFIAIEIYSLSLYLLILLSPEGSNLPHTGEGVEGGFTKINTFYSILYYIFNSIGSFLLLFSFIILYYILGITSLDSLFKVINNNTLPSLPLLFIFISIFFKLGLAPFHFWAIRIYKIMDSYLLLYFIFIPKIVYIFILLKFLNLFIILQDSNFTPFLLLFLSIALISSIIGSIGGLYQNNFNLLITYSSIFNLGFFLFGLLNYFSDPSFGSLHTFEFLFIYFFNLFSLFLAFFAYSNYTSIIVTQEVWNRNIEQLNKEDNISGIYKFKNFFSNYPFLALSFVISIFSFIGLPPFSGFFAKINIFYSLINNNNNISIYFILFLFIVTLFSASLYLKFIYSIFFSPNPTSSLFTHTSFVWGVVKPQKVLINFSNLGGNINGGTYSLSLFTLVMILYPIISLYFFPYFFFIF